MQANRHTPREPVSGGANKFQFTSIEGFKHFSAGRLQVPWAYRSEEHTSELQSQSNLVCRLLLEKKKCSHTSHEQTGKHQPQAPAVRRPILDRLMSASAYALTRHISDNFLRTTYKHSMHDMCRPCSD